jgi:hypothetical protein
MITTKMELITPSVASAMLEGNVDNRTVAEAIVNQYASDMAAGRWALSGQPIIISDDGYLNDGQHRLLAIVKSGMSVEMLVVRGVSRESRSVVDIGKVRSAGNVVSMFHVPNGNAIAALANMVLSWEATGKKSMGRRFHVGKAGVIERAKSDPRLIMSDRIAGTTKDVILRKHVSFARYIIADSAKSDSFFERLADGAGLEHGHPILTLRNWFLRQGRRVPDAVAIEAILRAWCAFRDGRSISMIKLLGELPTP